MGICGTRITQTPRPTGTRWKGWSGWANATDAQRNNKCSRVAHAPLDMTGLENSFENLGRKMVNVLTIQQQTSLTLQDQVRRANDAQMEQTLAMHDLVDMTEQRTYDSMFTAVPIYHGNDDEDFDEWADELEALCEIS